jgi:hypothetical protein
MCFASLCRVHRDGLLCCAVLCCVVLCCAVLYRTLRVYSRRRTADMADTA